MNKIRVTVRELVELVGGEARGNCDREITGVSSIEEAAPGDIVFAESPRHIRMAADSEASAIICPLGANATGKAEILVRDPRRAFAQILELFAAVPKIEPGIDPSSHIGDDFHCGQDIVVQYGCHIGSNVTLGDRVNIHPLVYVGDDVTIGSDVEIHPQVAVYGKTVVGDRVAIHSGSVIGSDGFGYVKVDGKHQKIPHIGKVVIGDDVEIGANATIDRARTGSTKIGSGTKIDNLAHIAHNVKIGENSIVVALVGIAGSVTIGNNVILAGQVGVKDHVRIGDDVVVTACAGVIGDLPDGACVAGFPARDYHEQMRAYAAQQRLPEMMKLVRSLADRVADLERRLSESGPP